MAVEDMCGELLRQLTAALPVFDRYDRYFDGQQRLKQLGLAIPPELEHFTVIVNWPRVVAEARVDRLDMKGFRVGGNSELARLLWEWWQSSGLAEDQSSYLDFEIYGRSFKVVSRIDDAVRVENVSPMDIICHRDVMTGQIDAALRWYRDVDSMNPYQPLGYMYWTQTTTYVLDADLRVIDSYPTLGGVIPVVPAYRNPRTSIPLHEMWPRLRGTSCLSDVIDITDACARDISNAQLAQETHAVPQRVIAGVQNGDFVDPETGQQLTTWEAYFGRIWALANENAKTSEFSSSSMENFERMVGVYARLCSGVTGLPPNYFGLAADDAASADAIRSREAKLVKSIERDQRALGDQAVQVCRIAVMMSDVGDIDELDAAQALWYDAGTPTVAQRADAVTKMFAAADANGRSLLPREMAWEELGWGPDKIERAKRLLADEEMSWMSEPMLKPLTGEGGDDVRADLDAAATPSGARTAPQVEPARYTDRPHLAAQ